MLLKKRVIKIISSVSNNSFVKISSANGLISIAKSFLVIISNKVVAVVIGSTGVAMVGQLQNFIQLITLVSNGGFNQGVTKYIAQDKNNKKNALEIIGTAFIFSFLITFITTILILLFSKTISLKIFTTTNYISIIVIFALTLFFFNLNSLILAVVNGFQEYRKYFKINITTTVVGFLLTISLVLILKEYGALLAIVLSPSVVCFLAFIYVRKNYWVNAFLFKYFKKEKLLLLLKYTSITVFSAATWPIVTLVIRTYVINNISAEEAGLWQATININNYIVNIAIGSFSVYLLPKLSSITDKFILKKELINIYKIIIPVSLIVFFLIYILRDYVILILYSKGFMKVGDYLLLQMIGSFFWMCKMPIQYYMLAKEHTKIYIINDVIFAIIYVVLAIILIPLFEVQGIQIAFVLHNFLYLLTNIFLIKRFLR
jgi:PST family polysaccharide transporter